MSFDSVQGIFFTPKPNSEWINANNKHTWTCAFKAQALNVSSMLRSLTESLDSLLAHDAEEEASRAEVAATDGHANVDSSNGVTHAASSTPPLSTKGNPDSPVKQSDLNKRSRTSTDADAETDRLVQELRELLELA